MTKNSNAIVERLKRWMLPHEQPQYLDVDHAAQADIAEAADEINRLTAERDALSQEVARAYEALGVASKWIPDEGSCGPELNPELAIVHEAIRAASLARGA